MVNNKKFKFFITLIIIFVVFIIIQTTYNYISYKTKYYKIINTRDRLKLVSNLIKKYYLLNNRYPENLNMLIPNFIKYHPKDSWGKEILFDMSNGFLYSFGADSKDGTLDDIFYKIKTPLSLTKVKVIEKNRSRSNYLSKGDIIRLYFSDNVCGFGKTPENDFLFYDHRGYPLMGITIENGGKQEYHLVSFGKSAHYSFVEENQTQIDLIIGSNSFIVLDKVRINLKYRNNMKKKSKNVSLENNSFFNSENDYSLSASSPLLIGLL